MAMLDRRYKRVTIDQIVTLMTWVLALFKPDNRGYFYCQSSGENNRAITLLAEACQLTHVLCLRTPIGEQDHIERELRHRVFWHVYAVDT
jgi:hypothetical protein